MTISRRLAARPLFILSGVALLAMGVVAVAQSDTDGEDDATIPFALPQTGPFTPAEIEIENESAIADWFRSAHANAAAEAFRHWDEEGEIREECATCHSGEGFRDFHGLDGSEAGVIDHPINVGGVVDCGTCHNAGLATVEAITFPSGLVHPVQGVEASCLTCHQGRTAGVTVVRAIGDLPEDEPNAELRFINPHYATAAATWLGGYGGAGYHYDDQEYSGRFFHARPVASCNSCHEPHTLEVDLEPCQTCHEADSVDDIRIARQSYDGSGNTSVGIRSDINANADRLLDMLRDYTQEVANAPVIHDGTRYPYFFLDANGDGVIDVSEGRPVAYSSWTPRSLRAAYNWSLVTADPGNFAHNPYYSLELLYDSIADLAGPLGVDIDDLDLLR
jgi:hypothetical protein